MADLFDIVTARKLSGGGGGGSSDFSTAEVTLNLTPPEGVSISELHLSCDFYYPSESYSYNAELFPADENNKCNIVLYRGYGYVGLVEAVDAGYNPYYLDYETASFSGGAIFDEETGAIVVTDNCTITGSVVLGG